MGFDSGNHNTLASYPNILTASVPHPAYHYEGIVSPFPTIHCQGSETGLSLPSGADVVNMWSNKSYAFTSVERENVFY